MPKKLFFFKKKVFEKTHGIYYRLEFLHPYSSLLTILFSVKKCQINWHLTKYIETTIGMIVGDEEDNYDSFIIQKNMLVTNNLSSDPTTHLTIDGQHLPQKAYINSMKSSWLSTWTCMLAMGVINYIVSINNDKWGPLLMDYSKTL